MSNEQWANERIPSPCFCLVSSRKGLDRFAFHTIYSYCYVMDGKKEVGGGGWPNFKLFWSTWDPLSSRKALADKNEAIKCGVWPLSSLHMCTALLIADWLRQLWYYPIKGQEWEKIYTKMQHRENGRWEEFNAKYFIRKNGERAKYQWLNLFAISNGCINKYHHSIGAHFLCAIFLLVV